MASPVKEGGGDRRVLLRSVLLRSRRGVAPAPSRKAGTVRGHRADARHRRRVRAAGARRERRARPLNDLLALGQGGGQTPARPPSRARRAAARSPRRARMRAGVASPSPGSRAACPPARRPSGLTATSTLVAHQGTSGGFKVLRYVDAAGHECAFYDTALLFPLNALKLDTHSLGVAVLDMSDPAHPVQTATLTELPMLSPHESLNLNPARGLLAAVLGNPVDLPGPGLDLRRPRRTAATRCCSPPSRSRGSATRAASRPTARRSTRRAPAIEVDHRGRRDRPEGPARRLAGQRRLARHVAQRRRQPRLHRRPDGGEHADPRRQPDPGAQARPAGARGQPADLEVGLDPAERDPVHRRRQALRARVRRVHAGDDRRRRHERGRRGADHRHRRRARAARGRQPAPAGQPARRPRRPPAATRARSAPSRATPPTTATSRREVDPTVVACSFIASGLRVFDISDLLHPKEIAYYVAPTQPRAENEFMASDFAMSKPAIVPARREVWYTRRRHRLQRAAGRRGRLARRRRRRAAAPARRRRAPRLPVAAARRSAGAASAGSASA